MKKIIFLGLLLFYSGCIAQLPSWSEEDFPLKVYADSSLTDNDLKYLDISINLHNSQLGNVLELTANYDEAQIIIKSTEEDIVYEGTDMIGITHYPDIDNKISIYFEESIYDINMKICTISHELGHAFGHLSHSENTNALMSAPSYCSEYNFLDSKFEDLNFYQEFKEWFKETFHFF